MLVPLGSWDHHLMGSSSGAHRCADKTGSLSGQSGKASQLHSMFSSFLKLRRTGSVGGDSLYVDPM